MKKADEVLSRLLEHQPQDRGPYASLFGGWGELVGDSLAEHSRVYELRHRTLIVDVDHPGWMQLLMLKKPVILGRIRRRYPQLEIRDVKVRVREGGLPKEEQPRTPRIPGRPEPTGETTEEIEQALRLVPDAGLKEKLRRLLLRSIERRHD